MTDAGRFATTRWSMVVAAGDADNPEGRAALEELCASYWYPLYAYVRRRGSDVHEAQDLTQGFFATVIEKGYLEQADRERGHFRSFLIAAFGHFVSHERERARAQKRGGGKLHFSIDFEAGEGRYRLEPADDTTPERIYERRWALTLLERVLAQLEADHEHRGKSALFAELRPFLSGAEPSPAYREVAARLDWEEGAVKVAVHRLRRHYRHALRTEISHTVSDPADIDDEIRYLLQALAR